MPKDQFVACIEYRSPYELNRIPITRMSIRSSRSRNSPGQLNDLVRQSGSDFGQ